MFHPCGDVQVDPLPGKTSPAELSDPQALSPLQQALWHYRGREYLVNEVLNPSRQSKDEDVLGRSHLAGAECTDPNNIIVHGSSDFMEREIRASVLGQHSQF